MTYIKSMETKYNGYVIKYNESDNEFVCEVEGEGVFKADNLIALKRKLDKIGSEEEVKQAKQKAILIEDRWKENKIVEYEVGKFGLVRRYSFRSEPDLLVWLTKIDEKSKYKNERRREYVDSGFEYYQDTLENRELAQQILDLREEINLLEEKNNKKIEIIKKKLKSQIVKPTIEEKDLPVWDK